MNAQPLTRQCTHLPNGGLLNPSQSHTPTPLTNLFLTSPHPAACPYPTLLDHCKSFSQVALCEARYISSLAADDLKGLTRLWMLFTTLQSFPSLENGRKSKAPRSHLPLTTLVTVGDDTKTPPGEGSARLSPDTSRIATTFHECCSDKQQPQMGLQYTATDFCDKQTDLQPPPYARTHV